MAVMVEMIDKGLDNEIARWFFHFDSPTIMAAPLK